MTSAADLSESDLQHLIRSAGYEPVLVDSSYQFAESRRRY